MFENKKIFILGMARSGYEAAKLLSRHHNEIVITDAKEQDSKNVKELEDLGVKVVITNEPLTLFDDTFDYVIKNPGIKPEHPICKKAFEYGIPVTNEVEVAYSFIKDDVKIVSITGSNGKTTTTTLIYELLKKAGFPVHLGGNIGIPVCSLVSDVKKGDILVLEISGHQQHDFIHYQTNIAVMTNLSPVHLDFFGSYENYKHNKSKILHDCEVAVLNACNKDVLEVSKDSSCKKLYFGDHKDCYLEDDTIYYLNKACVNTKNIVLKGMHNYENIMASILCVKELGVSDEVIKDVLSTFKGVPHRIELVGEVNGRTFYNDSKSTNCVSTITALKTFTTPIILILGGLDRGHSFDPLLPYMEYVKQVISYGETGNRISEWCEQNHIKCDTVQTIKEVVLKAYNVSDKGDIILLSPACASWDQYNAFEERGEDFKNSVYELEGN